MSSTVSLCTEISATKVPDKKLDPPTATRDRVELSVVMPCLNERETVGICVLKAIAALRQAGISGEVIVADNGSIDGSVEIAQTQGARVVNVAEKGYGNAVKGGILTACGDYILMADSDDSYDLSHIPRFVGAIAFWIRLGDGQPFQRRHCANRRCPFCIATSEILCSPASGDCFSVQLARTSTAAFELFARTVSCGWISARRAWNSPARWSSKPVCCG